MSERAARLEEAANGPVLENGLVRIETRLASGTYDICTTGGAPVISSAAVTVILPDGTRFSTRGEDLDFTGHQKVNDAQGKGITLFLSREASDDEPGLHILLTLYEGQPFAVAQAEVQNLAGPALPVKELRPLDGGVVAAGEGTGLRFYKHGWQSWSPAIVLDCAGDEVISSPPVVGPGTRPAQEDGRFLSELVTAVAGLGGGVVAGFISTADQFSQLWFDRDSGLLTAASYADGVPVAHRASLSSERLYIEPTVDPVRSLQTYGNALGREMDAPPPATVTSGWCSWYYYWQGVSQAEVIANLEELAATRERLPVEYVQIDDGYQAEIGDWLTVNEKFPDGMKWLADRIHEKGFKAGIWVAPFLAGARSRLFQEHPDWFVQFSAGGPAIATLNWGQLCHALDLTHPEVQQWLRDTFRTIAGDWGYDYVKIDFIYAGALDGVRHDPGITRAQAYRRGLDIIRDAVGERFILACGNPQGPSVGLVDGARIGPDVAPYWHPFDRGAPRTPLSDPSALNSIRNTLTRYWMHNRLWANDPDCLLVRDTDTALSGDEVRTLATVIGLTGGMVLDSDNLMKLNPGRTRIISLLLPVYGKSGVPLDLFDTPDVPRLLELDCNTHRLLGVFNWDDTEDVVSATLPPGNWHAFEFWEESYAGNVSGRLEAAVPGRGCRLFRLTPVEDRPQVVSSTLHITQGAMEIASEEWDGERLTIGLRPVACADGSIYVARHGSLIEIPVTGLRGPRTIQV
jgi:alpha-galactosidase